MISETPVYLQVETRYIPSTTQMISTFEVSSVEFDNKRLTSALKKRHRYHFWRSAIQAAIHWNSVSASPATKKFVHPIFDWRLRNVGLQHRHGIPGSFFSPAEEKESEPESERVWP